MFFHVRPGFDNATRAFSTTLSGILLRLFLLLLFILRNALLLHRGGDALLFLYVGIGRFLVRCTMWGAFGVARSLFLDARAQIPRPAPYQPISDVFSLTSPFFLATRAATPMFSRCSLELFLEFMCFSAKPLESTALV